VTVREQIKIDVLGAMKVRVGGRPAHLGGPKQRALLAVLVLRHGRIVPVEQLVDVLWGGSPPATATTKVQGHVYAIRKALAERGRTEGVSALETRPPGYLLRREPVITDLSRFDALTAAARDLTDPHRAAGLLTAALGLWRGPAFADVATPPIRAAAQRLHARYLAAAEDKAEIDLELGRYRQVLDELGVLIRRWPRRERLRELQLKALVAADRPHEALARHRD
jgi:SARP family transcriptional regulator, regulator of embCAB operon